MNLPAINIDKRTKLLAAAGVAVALLAGSVIYNIRNKKRDRNAALFFSELERKIAPAAVGLVESEAFDIYYWQKAEKGSGKKLYYLKQKNAADFAESIYDAWGWANDNEEKVYSVFRALKDQVQVSQVAYRYFQKYKVNLIDDLRSRMDKGEVAEVMSIVSKLPAYRSA